MLKETVVTVPISCALEVLILILMEHAQREALTRFIQRKACGLNPYFNGTCSKSWGW